MTVVASTTTNYDFSLINFDVFGWHDAMNANFTNLDAILAANVAFVDASVYAVSTAYAITDKAIDQTNQTIYRCLVAHTSHVSNTFSAARAANPTYWEVYSAPPSFAGRTLTGTTGEIDIADGDGVAGDPIFSLSHDLVFPERYGMPTVNLGTLNGAETIDLDDANFFYGTCTGNVTWTFSNPMASGTVTEFTLEITNGGAGVQTWPASVDWPGGIAPTLQVSGVDVLYFYSRDGGTIYRGGPAMLESS